MCTAISQFLRLFSLLGGSRHYSLPCVSTGHCYLNYLGGSFPSLMQFSQCMHWSVHGWILPEGALQIFRRYDILSLCRFSFWSSFLRTPGALVSWECQFHLLNSGSLQSPPDFFLPVLQSRSSLKTVIGLIALFPIFQGSLSSVAWCRCLANHCFIYFHFLLFQMGDRSCPCFSMLGGSRSLMFL